MSRRPAKALSGHPLAIASTVADLDAELHRLALTSDVYVPAGPQTDDPAEWAVRPLRFARFRCECGARFHVRRHLETHACLALTRETTPESWITTLITENERTR